MVALHLEWPWQLSVYPASPQPPLSPAAQRRASQLACRLMPI
jgi:hypothetical protein